LSKVPAGNLDDMTENQAIGGQNPDPQDAQAQTPQTGDAQAQTPQTGDARAQTPQMSDAQAQTPQTGDAQRTTQQFPAVPATMTPPAGSPYDPASGTWAQSTPYQPYQTSATPPAKTGGWRKAAVATVAGAAVALTAGGVGGFVGYSLHGDGSPLQNIIDSSQSAAPVVDRSSLSKIAAAVQPTVVVVETGNGEGSGVIISADGYIVTNNHVVAGDRGDTVRVTFNSGKQVQATIVGTDPKTDLAVVKADNASDLRFATWADSDAVQVGDTVLAIGSPLGLQGSVTAGIVSALHRTITVGNDQRSQFDTGSPRTTIGDAIQTDAPINPGNSGGALVNMNGQVVGINSAIATSGSTGNIGVGFAISSNRAKAVADTIIKGGKVSHPYLGVSVGAAENGGAQIQQVVSGGPAAQAGLQVGDVVTKIGNKTITGREDLVGAVQAGQVGQRLQITFERGGSERTATVTLVEQP
jgi:putative serine protease PepD